MKFSEMNVPNKLTTIRMFCVPLMLVLFIIHLLFLHTNISCDMFLLNRLSLIQLFMLLVFVVASITDFVDGHIARKYNLVTDYGKLMDPLADKLLVNTTLICLLAMNTFFQYQNLMGLEILACFFSILVIARDIFVDALRMQALRKNIVVPAKIFGKLKTATLMPGIALLIISGIHVSIFIIGLILIILGGIFALISGISYYNSMKQYIGDEQ